MASVTIELMGMAVLVTKNSKLIALLPTKKHHLVVDGTGHPAGSLVTLSGTATGVTQASSAGKFICDLQLAIDDPTKVVDPALLSGAVDSARLNARVELGGGTLSGNACAISPWDTTPWPFNAKYTHLITDSVTFEREIPSGGVDLQVNGATVRTLTNGDTVVIQNEDDPLGPTDPNDQPDDIARLDDFVSMCRVLNGNVNLSTVTFKQNLKDVQGFKIAEMAAAGPVRICMLVISK